MPSHNFQHWVGRARRSGAGSCSGPADRRGGAGGPLSPGPAPLLLHDCRAVPGESGSALLQVEAGGPVVIGVLVAGSREEGRAPSVAVPTAAFRETAAAMRKAQATTR